MLEAGPAAWMLPAVHAWKQWGLRCCDAWFGTQGYQQRSRSIKLYVKRVFISDEFDEDLMPRWGEPRVGTSVTSIRCMCHREAVHRVLALEGTHEAAGTASLQVPVLFALC
jgi:hypothetical protein